MCDCFSMHTMNKKRRDVALPEPKKRQGFSIDSFYYSGVVEGIERRLIAGDIETAYITGLS